ncbi:MAG: NADPH-dependent F420 reductase [Acidimicrobiales bacterium]|nr:NADPH-dependent F420 reductase [Acidimicrobiales bacterium]
MLGKKCIGIIGGTGPAGLGMALRLGVSGHEVVVGSRDEKRGADCVKNLKEGNLDQNIAISGSDNAEASKCETVIVATPWDATIETLKPLKANLEGKKVVSMVNALMKTLGELEPLIPGRGSMALEIQRVLPKSLVIGAFHHLPAANLNDLAHELSEDVAVFGDNKEAVLDTANIVNSISGLRAIYVGSLSQGLAVESFTAVLVSASIKNKGHVSIKFTGLDSIGSNL